QDQGGNENDHLYRVNPESREVTDLTPVRDAKAVLILLSPRRPGEALIGINDRDHRFYDAYRVNLVDGKRELVYKNEGFVSLIADDDLKVRAGLVYATDFKARI